MPIVGLYQEMNDLKISTIMFSSLLWQNKGKLKLYMGFKPKVCKHDLDLFKDFMYSITWILEFYVDAYLLLFMKTTHLFMY